MCRSCSREALRAKRKRGQKIDDRCDECGPTCPATVKIVQRRMGMMIVNQEQEVPSEERCKEELTQFNATIERGVPDGKEVRGVGLVASQSSVFHLAFLSMPRPVCAVIAPRSCSSERASRHLGTSQGTS